MINICARRERSSERSRLSIIVFVVALWPLALSLRVHIACSLLWKLYAPKLIDSLQFVGEHMFSQIRPALLGVHDPLFMATNVDRSDCVHVSLSTLQRR